VVAAVTGGVLATAWPAFADEGPAPTPTVSTSPSFPDPPQKPEPTGSPDPTTPPTGPILSPPPFPPGGGVDCDPVDPDCV
jgi:hypothetical protein